MAKVTKTDLQVIRALLSMAAGKLSPSEKNAFQGMFDVLATGRIPRLSMRQRMWACEVYEKHKLDEEQPPARKIAVRDKSLIVEHPLDQMPRPLRPPGR